MNESMNKQSASVEDQSPRRVRGRVSVSLPSSFWVLLAALIVLPAHDTDPYAMLRISITGGLVGLVVVSEVLLAFRNSRRD